MKRILRSKLFFGTFLIILVIGLAGYYSPLNVHNQRPGNKIAKLQQPQATNSPTVLGQRAPQIYVSGGRQGYSGGGMIALASTDEPVVAIEGYGITGNAEVSVYEANEEALLDYLTHNKEGKQTKKNPDISSFRYISKVDVNITASSGSGTQVLLPLGETGIYFLRIKMGSVSEDSFVIRSRMGSIVKEGNNEYIFWAQDFKSGKSLTEGSLSIYNLQDSLKEIGKATLNSQGIAKTALVADADIAIIRNAGDKAIVPINLRYLNSNYRYNQFEPKTREAKYFIFTDRPLYRPGDTIYFKSILRDDDDASYSVPSGKALVKVYNGYGEENVIFEKNYDITSDGTVSGEYKLPDTSKTGYYSLSVSIPGSTQGSASFNVEFFKKPEYSIDVTTPKTELIAGDTSSFTISGSYFSGQPLANQKVKYTIYSSDFYTYDYLIDQSYALNDDYRYGYWGGNILTSGNANLNKAGIAEIALNTKIPKTQGRSQVISIEAEFDDGSGSPSFSRKNVLVYAGEYDIYRKDTSYYSTKLNTQLLLPVTLVSHRTTNVSGFLLTAKVHRENWIPYQEENKKYLSYKREEEDLPDMKAQTDGQGNATFTFTPTKVGSYRMTVEGKDTRGNTISKIFYSYVSSENEPYYVDAENNDVTIHTDKQKYLPSDTVRLTITSTNPNRDVFLSLERGRVNRFQIVNMNGKTAVVNVPLGTTDMPNIYAKVSSFSTHALDTNTVNVVVSAESKKLVVTVTPHRKTFGPGQDVTVNVETKDIAGNPVAADVALWTVDKAIFELVDEKPEKIFDTFWKERYDDTREAHSLEGITVLNAEMGGCFASGTQVLMGDGLSKSIEKMKSGDIILTRESDTSSKLVKAKVASTHERIVSGYFIINSNLRVTSNHKLWVNNSWKEASTMQIGDMLTDAHGKAVSVSSVEWVGGKFTVYNLEVEKYKTYFANGIFVHNQKGSPRAIFKDTAYWNPSIHTDALGRAQVNFRLPDNLTTWVVAAVGSTIDTKVGQTTNEIVVTKDVIVRPLVPNILRVGDKIVLSALVQNFIEDTQTFDVDLAFDAGDVSHAAHSAVTIKSKEMQQVDWEVLPKQDKEKAKLTFSARSKENKNAQDSVVQEIPVRPFGFFEQSAQTGDGTKSFSIRLAEDSSKEKSTITLSLAPTILGTLPTAMQYLVNYPYGCIEQTTSRFVPAVIAKTNPDLFATALEGKDINDMIAKGLSRLAAHQQGDGGWTWWYTGKSDPFITAYVVEYVLQAQQAGIAVDKNMLSYAQAYLENPSQQNTPEDVVARTYGLTLLNAKNRISKLDTTNLAPDILALAIMANYKNGDTNPQTNGLARLEAMAKQQGDGVFWEAGRKQNFASTDASTAFAIRAIVTANGNRALAIKGARYLTRNRKFNYWSNTFATAQVIRAITDLTKTGDELTPNYTYEVLLDNKQIAKGTVSSSKQVVKDIAIPAANIGSNGSTLTVSKTGEGQMYSTMLVNEFHTDSQAKALSHGLTITREYINDKGPEYSLSVGDTATVNITVSGLGTDEYYGVITDELPSGLVPINETLKNQQYQQDQTYYYYDGVSDREVTENGIVLSLYKIASGLRTYSYKARVVSVGTFAVPPATVSLMYAPEIYGRSDAQTIEVTKESKIIPSKAIAKAIKEADKRVIGSVALLLIILISVGAFIIKKHRSNE